ncbi:MAG: conjugal transfer protein TraF [Rhodocyclaceae bacterium]
MSKTFPFAVLALLAPLAHADDGLDYPSVWICDANKPHWYCDLDESRPAPTVVVPQASATKGLAIRDIKSAEALRAELKRREDLAVMNPTEANLKNYLALWQLVQEKGAVFADSWRRVVWQNPELDYSLRRPANNAAIKTFDAQREESEAEHLKALAQVHGLIFFFRSDCPYCHAMAPTLKLLSERFGIEVLPVSVDGPGLLPEYPNPTDGRGQAAAWGVERVPALFIGSKFTGDHAAVGFGQMALTEIVDRIFVLTGTVPGQNF